MPWCLKPVKMKITQVCRARKIGIAMREVAGNWMNGTVDQMLMKKIQKNSVARNGAHLRPASSPITSTAIMPSTVS